MNLRCKAWITNVFIVLNQCIVGAGVALTGAGAWLLEKTSVTAEFRQSPVFGPVTLVFGLAILISGILGIVAGLKKSILLQKWFLGLGVLLLLAEVFTSVGVYVEASQGKMAEPVQFLWRELPSSTRAFIQQEMQCCGYQEPVPNTDQVPQLIRETCVDITQFARRPPTPQMTRVQDLFWTRRCQDAMYAWLKTQSPWLGSILALLLLLQITTLVLSGLLIWKASPSSGHQGKMASLWRRFKNLFDRSGRQSGRYPRHPRDTTQYPHDTPDFSPTQQLRRQQGQRPKWRPGEAHLDVNPGRSLEWYGIPRGRERNEHFIDGRQPLDVRERTPVASMIKDGRVPYEWRERGLGQQNHYALDPPSVPQPQLPNRYHWHLNF